MTQPEPKIVIGVPGKWKDRSDIVTSIVRHSGGYLFAGKILMHAETHRSFELEIYDHDPSLAAKTRSGGMGQIPEEDLIALEDHTHTLYLLSDQTGKELVADLIKAAAGLLNSGGIAVKVEFAGFSHAAAKWREYARIEAVYNHYRCMVVLVGDEDKYYTCGMSAFGLPDCSVQVSDLDAAFELANEFCCFLIGESPDLRDGHTFSLRKGAPRYRLQFENYFYYTPGHSFHNPNGLWQLRPVTE